jgi:hypothetical protein
MTKRIWTGVFTAIVGSATVAITAQTPAPSQPAPSSTDRTITVTGCLKEAPGTSAASSMTAAPGTAGTAGTAGTTGTAGATGTAGTSGEAASSTKKFVLTDAAPGVAPPDPDPATATTSTPGAPPASAATMSAAQTYQLIANAASLGPHVGKKLELTGTLEPPTPGTESTASAEASAMTLRVESGKIIAASCSQ